MTGSWLYLAEGHPLTLSLDEVEGRLWWPSNRGGRQWRPLLSKNATPLAHTRSYEWCHPLGDIIGGLLNAGLHLDFLHEHERLP